MTNYTYTSNGQYFEQRYVRYEDVGLSPPETEGTLYTWAYDTAGILGQNTRSVNLSSPTQVGTDSDWVDISTGSTTSLARKQNGSVWSWGINLNGELGINKAYASIRARSSPVQIGSELDWKKVFSGNGMSFFIKDNNTLWSCGNNASGQLGQNDTINRSSPTQVGADTNWYYLSGFNSPILAIKTDGTLWGWGTNTNGELGLNNRINYSSPVQIGSDTNWSKVATTTYSTLMLKTDGTIWASGNNTYGQLGQNNTVFRSSPVQIGIDSNWTDISSGGNFGPCLGLKTDGTLWAWGYDTSGALGLNTRAAVSSPTQIGADTDWSIIATGLNAGGAIKTDGTLWGWGYQLIGDGTNFARSSPVQIGTETDWFLLNVGQNRNGLRL